MISSTADYGVAGFARLMWSSHAPQAFVATPPAHTAFGAHPAGAAAAIAAQRKRRANAAPTIASVDRSFI
ncbi:hypothetical protein B1R94_20945 [Mycolicibacterium litorale]|nr:hypothetical protein B1R94_20945 [Mycolicibacterium litorale]